MSKKQVKLTSLWMDSDDEDDDDCIILDPLPAACSSVKKPASVSVVKVGSTKKANQWVSSAFDGFGDFTTNTKPATKNRNGSQQKISAAATGMDRLQSGKRSYKTMSAGHTSREVEKRASKTPEMSLWSEKYTPASQADLAVHKKKISDVEQWIQGRLNNKKLPPILLLTGPAGVGKTATVHVLAEQLKCEIHEWSNPLTSDAYDSSFDVNEWRSRSRVEAGISTSQKARFQEFLLRANKYNTLNIFGGGINTKRLLLVEDFPNTFYRDASPFHDLLRKYVQVGGSPLIFIISDSTSGESNERLLFPKDIQAQLNIENISFNPVAMTSLTKVLSKIATDESQKGSHKFTVPSKSVIESIAMASAGDIRGSVNALQFACLRDTCDLAAAITTSERPKLSKRGSKKSSKTSLRKASSFQKEEELMSIGGRDTSLFLFRALGKILYCKRDEPSADTEVATLPRHLSQYYRDPLRVNPEEVVEKSNMSGDYFSAYIHQNYLEFYTSVEDVVSASEYLSDADYLTIDWASRSALQHYAASVATRGIMFCNSARAKHGETGGGLGWKPLHKPQWYATSKMQRQNNETARYLFRACRSAPVLLQTELIPYMSLINTTLHDTGQISFMQEICRFSSQRVGRYEKLDEKDVDVSIEDSDVTQLSANQTPAPPASSLDTDDAISSSQ